MNRSPPMARPAGASVDWLVPLGLAALAAGFLRFGQHLALGPSLPVLLALAAGLLVLHSVTALHLRQTTAFLAGLELMYGLLLLLRSHSAPLLGLNLSAFGRLQAVSIPPTLILIYALGQGSPLEGRTVLRVGLIVALPFLAVLALRLFPETVDTVLQLRLIPLQLPLALPQIGLAMLPALALLLVLLRSAAGRGLYELCLAAVLFPRYLLLQQAAAGTRAGFPGRAALTAVLLLLALLYGLYRLFWERAFLDELTGLGNRRSFEDALRALPRRFALAMIDLDHFKAVNDTYGHAEGDNVLRWVASHVKRAFGAAAFRYGGEEFAVLLPETEPEKAREQLEGLRRAVAQAQFALRRGPDRRGSRKRPGSPKRRAAVQDRRSAGRDRRRPLPPARARRPASTTARRLQVTVSIGLSAAAGVPERPQEVLLRADAALYRAKEGGRNRVVVAAARQSGSRTVLQGRSRP